MNDSKIRELIELYFEGGTTLEQEQQIAEYFASAQSVAKDLLPYKAMFTAFSEDREVVSPVAPAESRPRWRIILGAVSSVAVAACVVIALFFFSNKPAESDIICYVDGSKITDVQRATDEAERILQGVSADMELAMAAIERINIQF